MARRPMMRGVVAGLLPMPPTLVISTLLFLLVAVLLPLPQPAYAGWGGANNRNDPRLAVKKPGSTLQVIPGQQFNVAITVKKAQRRLPALFEVVLPDGALFVGPKAKRHADKQAKQKKKRGEGKGFQRRRMPASTSGSDRKAKRAAARHFPWPDTIINGTAGERTLQWHLDTFKSRYNPIKLTFEVDFCGAPSSLAIRLNWRQGGRSARPAIITLNVLPSANAPPAPETFIDWNAPVPPYESLLLIACYRPDPNNPGVCLECINDPSWALHDGRCVCAVGAGTHLTANTSAAGWSTTPPATSGGCRDRELHPGLATGSYGPLSCDPDNPRVAEAIFIDPPACACRPCPDGFTSDGGNPAQTSCFPAAANPVQALGITFGFEEDAPAVGGRRLEVVPADVRAAATALATAWAEALSHVPEKLLGALEPIADFTLDGPVTALESLWFSSKEGRYLFSARYVFHASEASRNAVVEAINGVVQDPDFTCASWITYAGVDMCAIVRQALPTGFRLVNPWAEPLPGVVPGAPGSRSRSMQQSTGPHRDLWFMAAFSAFNTLATFGSRSFTCFAGGWDKRQESIANKKPLGLEGQALFVESVAQVIGGIFSIVGIFQTQEDTITPYLKQIDETTRETLRQVEALQVQVGQVQKRLDEIETLINRVLVEVQEFNCRTANVLVKTGIQDIKRLWFEYCGTRTAVLGTAASNLEQIIDGSPVDPKVLDPLTKWAKRVQTSADGGVNVASVLDQIHTELIGDAALGGAIGACGRAFQASWKLAKNIPLDDRQYYNRIMTYLVEKIVYQTQGARMIQDAYLILAMDAVRNRAIGRNESFVTGLFTEQSNACDLMIAAYNQNRSSTLGAGRTFCMDRIDLTAKVYNNIVQQIEFMGMPLSNGDVGEGVRLLLGSDATGFPAVLLNARERTAGEPTMTNVQTRWLFPASLGTFDARCTNRTDVAQADSAGCPAVGTFRSCAYGCNQDPNREARWRLDKYVLGYPGSDWAVAGGAPWEELRGLLTGWMDNNTAVGDAADVMALLDRGIPIEATNGTVIGNVISPFVGMTKRPFWIVNKTAGVAVSDLAIDVIPKYKSWYGGDRPKCDLPTAVDDNYLFPWIPSMVWHEAQCLAAYNPTPNKDAKPRWAGATGVHCTGRDFAGLFKHWCHRNDPRCGHTHTFCNTTIKPELLERFGAVMQPSDGKKGNMSAACRWDQDWLSDTSLFWGGSCHLGPPADPQPAWHGYGLQWACEGRRHGDRSDQNYWRANSGWACAPEFSYAWLPELVLEFTGQKIAGWPNPTDSATRPMFRLPVLDINNIQCTPSPFVGVTSNNGQDPRPRRNTYNSLPTLCNDEMTQAVLSLVGPGQYEVDAGRSSAELKLADDGDTVTCEVTWDEAATPGVVTTNIYITVRDGPIVDTDRIDFTGNASFPLWSSSQTDLYFNATRIGSAPPQPTRTSISLSAALPRDRTSSANRVVGCTVVGEDPQTKLPITVFAVSKVVLGGVLPWEDFEYPIRTNTKACTVAGCISSVARNLSSAGGPGLLLAAGPAPNLAPPNDNVLFVRVQGSPTGLLQVVPVANSTQNLTEAVYSTTVFINMPSALPGLTGWHVDGQGRMYVTGKAEDGGYESPSPFVAALDFSPAPAPGGSYNTTATVKRLLTNFEPYCIQSTINAFNAIFHNLTSPWLEPASRDLVAGDAFCTAIYRIEASALDPNCKGPPPLSRQCGKSTA